MYISRISITNFRTFDQRGFEADLKPFTLLLGENNIGKSNIVAAISLLFGQDISTQTSRGLGLDDFNYSTVQAFKKQVADTGVPAEKVVFPEILIEADLNGMNDDQHAVVGDWYLDNTLELARVSYRFSLRGNFDKTKWVQEQRDALSDVTKAQALASFPLEYVDFPIREYRYLVFGGGVPSNECEAALLNMLRMEFLDALRDANRELVAGGQQRLLYRILAQEGDIRYSDLKSALANVKQAVDKNPALTKIKTDVGKLLDRVSLLTPNEINSIDFQFTAPEAAELLKKVGLIYGADPITVARNGLGRNNLLYVALVISQIARTDAPKADLEGYACLRVVCVEEPEAHLHPHLQDHLARNIESIQQEHNECLQLILTSHSTHLAAKLGLANTAVLFRDDTRHVKCQYVLKGLDEKKDKASIRFLSLYLDATKSRLLFARSVILVEGIAEQVVIPILFEKLHGKSLESLGCSVVSVSGVAFSHFLKLIKNGLYRRCVVLTDSDAGRKTENRAAKLKLEYDDSKTIKVQISNSSTFERDLLAVNLDGKGKDTMLRVLEMTKPKSGKKYKDEHCDKSLDVDTFFEHVEEYKAEFAFNLASVLTCAEKPGEISVPQYIESGLQFVADSWQSEEDVTGERQ